MFIPNFPTMDQASRYAEIHTPLKTAMEFYHEIDRKVYGQKAYEAAAMCWQHSNNGDQTAALKSMRALSWALPPSCFGR